MIPSKLDNYLAQPSPMEKALPGLFSRKRPLVIMDIGACEGEESIRYSRLYPRARIFCFEPLPSNQELIRAQLAATNTTSVELIPLALSDQCGEATFHVSSGQPQEPFSGDQWNYGNKSSSLLAPTGSDPMYGWIEFKETVRVATETLHHFCRERRIGRIDFIHMDVQGAELLVLHGAEKKMDDISSIWLEVSDKALYQGQPLRKEVESFMTLQGFWLAFEVSHGFEGDQFYVNGKHPSVWPWYLRIKTAKAFQSARFKAGHWKSRIIGFFR